MLSLEQRIDVLTQGVNICQKKGALTLDEAFNAKIAIDVLKGNIHDKPSINTLISAVDSGRKAGVLEFSDLYYICLAIDDIENAITGGDSKKSGNEPTSNINEPATGIEVVADDEDLPEEDPVF